ncbi:phenylalanine 4-monooxygenase [Vibrio nitrifigilis]|uniref:Phenylalanine-4-hydroxylase n=1 Tax=Vibrio nitrifigilis TaxID=2789781 RepID=A0ABS0GK59_9VIBR|nr:phenylalanine 4-monooxygenase [Vibrio nitrifigilis]MBF9002826.1 phenylalanine 4-monooxygenase [Vibrio nitrifigilis]
MTTYHSKPIDSDGKMTWTHEEVSVWRYLIERQSKLLPERACTAYLDGLDLLQLSSAMPPQLADINRVLKSATGWSVTPVPALIDFKRFFSLLAHQQFPIATFMRRRDEIDYLQEPDFFHEVFGHCAMLTNPDFAHFTHWCGQSGIKLNDKQRVFLARLYWFTVEFGLIKEAGELRIYGGGILSSPKETLYSLESSEAVRRSFNLLDILRTPYRIDIVQPVYYYLDSIAQLYQLSDIDLVTAINQAEALGLFKPLFTKKVC